MGDGSATVQFLDLGSVSASIEGVFVVLLGHVLSWACSEFVYFEVSETVKDIKAVAVVDLVEVGDLSHGAYFVVAIRREMSGCSTSLLTIVHLFDAVEGIKLITLMEACYGVGFP